MNYIISPVTTYDDENQLFETKIGDDSPEMKLLFSVWGPNEKVSRNNAVILGEVLNKIANYNC